MHNGSTTFHVQSFSDIIFFIYLFVSISLSLPRSLYDSISFCSFISSRLNRSIKHLPSGEVNDLKLASSETIESIYTTIEQRYHRHYRAKSKLKNCAFTFSCSWKKYIVARKKKLLFAKHPFPSHSTPLQRSRSVMLNWNLSFR